MWMFYKIIKYFKRIYYNDLFELSWLENPVNIYMRHTEHWTDLIEIIISF